MIRTELDLGRLHEWPIVTIDVETTGTYWYVDKVFGIAVAGYNPQTGHIASAYWDIRDTPRIWQAVSKAAHQCKFIANHFIKFDALMLGENFLPEDRLECTGVRAALINEHEFKFDLDALGEKYVGQGKDTSIYAELASLFGGRPTKDAQIGNLSRAPAQTVARYARQDVETAALLYEWQRLEIEKQDLHKVWDLERRLLPVLLRIERRGVRVDVDKARRSIVDTDKLIDDAQRTLDRLAGRPVNVNSPKQMREVFKVQKGEDKVWRTEDGMALNATDSGNPSIDADTLRTMEARGNPLAANILRLRKSTKGKSFLKDHILGHEVNGRVYPNYNQTRGENDLGTGTGRFSINDPALQQIPARDVEVASIVRACFIPEDGADWCSADWEQFEFRWFAHYTKDPRILNMYEQDPSTDFHQIVSDLVGIPRKPRFAGDANAKQINLGMVFGMGEGTLAEEMGLPYTIDSRGYKIAGHEAKDVFANYHGEIPGVKRLLNEASSIARNRGYVMTMHGRHIRFPGGKFTHKAGGLVFQGTSADCMKVKMIEMDEISRRIGFDLLLSVHDEQDFSVPREIKEEAKAAIKSNLEDFGPDAVITCRVPILSQVDFGPNWWEASK